MNLRIIFILLISLAVISASSAEIAPTYTEITAPFELNRGYKLNLLLPDINETLSGATFQLIHDGDVVDEKTFYPTTANFSLYDNRSLIITGNFEKSFRSRYVFATYIPSLVQYDKVTGETILSKDNFVLTARYASSPTSIPTITGTPVITPSLTPTATLTTTSALTMTPQLKTAVKEVKEPLNGFEGFEDKPSWFESTMRSILRWFNQYFNLN